MKTALLTVVVLVVMLGGGDPRSQELSTEIFPSEDEIFNALRSSEITYRQYLILQELITNGLDSTNFYLLDEIPNLSYFRLDTNSLRTSLEQEQQSTFTGKSGVRPQVQTVAGTITHRYDRYADENSRSRYITSARVGFGKNVTADVKLRREYSGRERITSRTVTYKGENVVLCELVIGSYSKRLGLGTVFGYRGKILPFSDDLDGESLLFPDYGGHNGIAAQLSLSKIQLQALGSVIRNEDYRLTSAAGMAQFGNARWIPRVLLGINRLENRATDQAITDIKYGVNAHYDYAGGYNSVEITGQTGQRESFGAIVTEGRHRFRKAEIRYAGWMYSDDYIDLTGGSKGAGLYRYDHLGGVDFEYSTKRSSQQGGLVKTIIGIPGQIELSNSVLYASLTADTINAQWLVELTRKLGLISVNLSRLSRATTRGAVKLLKRQTRLTARFSTGKLYIRAYLGYNTESAERDFLSVFVRLRYKLQSYGEIELWSNASQIDHGWGRIDYWYGYIRNSFQSIGHLKAAVKLSHTYRRASQDSDQTVLSLELSWQF
ncbi:MAG: hypothetical protein JSU74_00570 [Candidatus Zixiibacteriota bacterium]|nr:MAG: hypothetical protein JSU74_00570 [candidate division Zixibacteria bacterium]